MEYFISSKSLTFTCKGQSHNITSDHVSFTKVRDMLISGSEDVAEMIRLSNVKNAIEGQIRSAEEKNYLRPGTVQIKGKRILYDGIEVDSSLTQRMKQIIAEGGNITPWVLFMEKLYRNPNHQTRFELYDWMRSCKMPLTVDGDFLAYKRVRGDYMDVHSGTFSNRVGQVVALADRYKVDPNRNNHCSNGLHFCSAGYLPSFSGDRVMILKINPADVVSIPTDYNFTKGRCWQYLVLGEITLRAAEAEDWPAVVNWTEPDENITDLDLVESGADATYD